MMFGTDFPSAALRTDSSDYWALGLIDNVAGALLLGKFAVDSEQEELIAVNGLVHQIDVALKCLFHGD